LKKDHAAILRNLGIKKREEFALRFLSKKLNVLVEKTKDKKAALMKGFSQNYMQVRLEENNYSIVNNIVIVTVQAVKFRDGKLYEKIVSG
jgi:tRNA A37 methylthiotransferase MiaB